MTQNYAKLLRLLRSDSEVVRAHAAFTGANIIESLKPRTKKLEAKVSELEQDRNSAWDKGYNQGRSSWHQTIAALQDRVEELEIGIRDHIDWADTAVDCDELKILIGDMQEDE